jgi:hypothetical protein
MLLDRSHLVTQLIDLFRDTFEIFVLLVQRVETSIDVLKLMTDRLELFAEQDRYFLADDLARNTARPSRPSRSTASSRQSVDG